MKNITKEEVAAEDWSWAHMYPKTLVECASGHGFMANSKFSGRLIAIISRDPCPVCGTHELIRVSSGREAQTLTNKDVGDAEQNT